MADAEKITFTIEGKELENLRDWLDNHECAAPGPHDFNLYPWNIYEFFPTGFSTIIKVSCSRCGKTQNISDDARW